MVDDISLQLAQTTDHVGHARIRKAFSDSAQPCFNLFIRPYSLACDEDLSANVKFVCSAVKIKTQLTISLWILLLRLVEVLVFNNTSLLVLLLAFAAGFEF